MIRTGTFIFAPGQQSGNFHSRVRTGGGGFTQETGETFTVESGDVLIKLAEDDGPWFALFRDPIVSDAENPTDPTDPTDPADATAPEPEAAQHQQLESASEPAAPAESAPQD